MCVCVCVYVCVCVCMYVCTQRWARRAACMYVCMYVCTYVPKDGHGEQRAAHDRQRRREALDDIIGILHGRSNEQASDPIGHHDGPAWACTRVCMRVVCCWVSILFYRGGTEVVQRYRGPGVHAVVCSWAWVSCVTEVQRYRGTKVQRYGTEGQGRQVGVLMMRYRTDQTTQLKPWSQPCLARWPPSL